MAPFKAPRFIQFLNELPKTGQGKIDKRQSMEKNRLRELEELDVPGTFSAERG